MSRDWTPEELEAASQMMKAAGYMSFEEFCEAMDNGYFTEEPNIRRSSQLQPAANNNDNQS